MRKPSEYEEMTVNSVLGLEVGDDIRILPLVRICEKLRDHGERLDKLEKV